MNVFWRDKRVFVTGATGFIGSWLTKRLVDLGARLTILSTPLNTPSELIRSGYIHKLRVIQGCLQDFFLLEKVLYEHQIDTVFHLGAQTQVKKAFLNPLETYESNVRGTYSLLEACRVSICKTPLKRIIVASSDKAYGEHLLLPYKEGTPLRATYPYDVSKACGDLIALSYYHTYQLPVVVTRCGNVYGGGDFNEDRLIPYVIRSLYENKAPVLRSNGLALRDYVFIEDVVCAYLALGESFDAKKLEGEVFNFGTNKPMAVIHIVHLLAKLMKKENIEAIVTKETKAELQDQYLNSEKAKHLLKWEPRVSLGLGLRLTVDWYEHFFSQESEQHSVESSALCSI